jgi:CheY-like chemotaxis protein
MPNRVFVSYAHENESHKRRVTDLVEDLRANGIDARFDRDVHGTPREGWPRWMESQIAEAVHVLVICTEVYIRRYEQREQHGNGRGATWEGSIIRQEMYDGLGNNTKFAAVMFDPSDEANKPQPLRPHTHYIYPRDRTDLVRWLTNQPAYISRPPGKVPALPPDPWPKALPAPLDNAPAPAEIHAKPRRTSDGLLHRRSVLIAEDTLRDIAHIIDYLRKCDCEVHIATNEKEARQRLDAIHRGDATYAVALFDVIMAQFGIMDVSAIDEAFLMASFDTGIRLCTYARHTLGISKSDLPIICYSVRQDEFVAESLNKMDIPLIPKDDWDSLRGILQSIFTAPLKDVK